MPAGNAKNAIPKTPKNAVIVFPIFNVDRKSKKVSKINTDFLVYRKISRCESGFRINYRGVKFSKFCVGIKMSLKRLRFPSINQNRNK